MRKGIKKLVGLEGSPQYVASGFALGSFIGMLPFPGFQMILSLGAASLLKVHKSAAVLGVFNTNIATGLFVFAFNYWIGRSILGFENSFVMPDALGWRFIAAVFNAGSDVFLALILGGIITGIPSALLSFYGLRYLLEKKGKRRDEKGIVLHHNHGMNEHSSANGNEKYTVITGASMGLGKHLAIQCAKRGRNVLLTSLPGEDVLAFAQELAKRYSIKAHGFEADLATANGVLSFSNWVEDNFEIDVLINNAGIGGTQRFSEASSEYLNKLLMLNTHTLVMLTHRLLPMLKKSEKAFILNIASMASFGPMPFKTVYPASKAFVYSFSRGLGSELKGSNVFVSVAHPGGMTTNPEVTERIRSHNGLVRFMMLSPEKTAEICIQQLFRHDSLIIPGLGNKVNWLLMKLFPVWLRLILFRKTLVKEIHTSALKKSHKLASS